MEKRAYKTENGSIYIQNFKKIGEQVIENWLKEGSNIKIDYAVYVPQKYASSLVKALSTSKKAREQITKIRKFSVKNGILVYITKNNKIGYSSRIKEIDPPFRDFESELIGLEDIFQDKSDLSDTGLSGITIPKAY